MYYGQIFTPPDLNLPFPIDKPQVSPHVRMHPQNPSGHTTRVFQSLVGTLAAYLKPSFRTKLLRMDGCPSWSCHDPLRCKTSGTSPHVRAMSCKRDTPSCPWREWSPWWTRTRTFFLKWSLIMWIKGRLRCKQFNIGIGCWQKICPHVRWSPVEWHLQNTISYQFFQDHRGLYGQWLVRLLTNRCCICDAVLDIGAEMFLHSCATTSYMAANPLGFENLWVGSQDCATASHDFYVSGHLWSRDPAVVPTAHLTQSLCHRPFHWT